MCSEKESFLCSYMTFFWYIRKKVISMHVDWMKREYHQKQNDIHWALKFESCELVEWKKLYLLHLMIWKTLGPHWWFMKRNEMNRKICWRLPFISTRSSFQTLVMNHKYKINGILHIIIITNDDFVSSRERKQNSSAK
jgi:hypothetical protein